MAEVTPGKETSEFKLAKWVLLVGGILAALGTILETLAQAGIGEKWVGGALAVVGTLTMIAESLGYRRSRTELKAVAIEAAVAEGEKAAQLARETSPLNLGVPEFKSEGK